MGSITVSIGSNLCSYPMMTGIVYSKNGQAELRDPRKGGLKTSANFGWAGEGPMGVFKLCTPQCVPNITTFIQGQSQEDSYSREKRVCIFSEQYRDQEQGIRAVSSAPQLQCSMCGALYF